MHELEIHELQDELVYICELRYVTLCNEKCSLAFVLETEGKEVLKEPFEGRGIKAHEGLVRSCHSGSLVCL